MSTRRRRSIRVDGLGHGQPIPNACRIGDLIWSGGINGADPDTGLISENLSDEVAQMFANLETIVRAADATDDDIIRLSVYSRDREVTSSLNEAWIATFPDEASRPARHLSIQEIHPALRIQCEFVAVASPADVDQP